MKCKWEHCDNILTGKQTAFCSKGCKSKHFTRKNRQIVKEKAMKLMGNACQLCGYDRCKDALHFHHKNPKEKSFRLSDGQTRSWKRVKKELEKCILVCANCHAEIHSRDAHVGMGAELLTRRP